MGAFSESFVAGFVGGAVATDPRRAVRRVFALLFAVAAGIVIFLATVLPLLVMNQSEYSDGDVPPLYAIAWLNFIMTFVIVIAGAKFSARLPFSVFKFPVHIVASLRTSVLCIVSWIVLLALCIITFLVTTSPVGVFFLDLLVMVIAFITGGTSVNALKKLRVGGEEVQIGVSRAMNVPPESIQMTWTGTLLKPAYIVELPYILQRDAFPMLQQNLFHALPSYQIVDVNESRLILAKP